MMRNVCNGKDIEAKLVRQVVSGGRGNRANSASSYFKQNKLHYPNDETSKASRKYVKAMKFLQVSYHSISQNNARANITAQDIIPLRSTFNRQFVDLLRKIFVYDPKARVTAKKALQHPWFKETIKDDGTEAFKIKLQKDGQGVIDLEDDEDEYE